MTSRSGSEEADLPSSGGAPGGVAADRDSPETVRAVGERTHPQAGDTRQSVGHSFDQPERRDRTAQGGSQQAEQQRRRDLVAYVGEEARRADAGDARVRSADLGARGAPRRR